MYIVISHALRFHMDVMFRNKVIELNLIILSYRRHGTILHNRTNCCVKGKIRDIIITRSSSIFMEQIIRY